MTLQGERQASVRSVTGTTLDYNGDWMALFDDAGIAAGDFNGRMLAWINDRLSSAYTNVNEAMAAFASDEGVLNFSSIGTFDASNGLARLPLYSTALVWGDGIDSNAACIGLRNSFFHLLILMKGRIRPTIGFMQAQSGGDMDTIYDRRAATIAQKPDIAIFGNQGHNDALFSSDYVAQMVKWERNLDYLIDNLPSTARILVCTTIKSLVSTETFGGDWQTTVNTAQLAAIAARQEEFGERIILCDTYAAYNDPANMSPSSDVAGVHPDERGGYARGLAMFNALDPYVETATVDDILNDVAAKSWRGANIHPDWALLNTGGTKSGTVAPTGNWPTGQRITNNLTNGTSVAVACSKDATHTPTYEEAIAEISGTPAATQTVVCDDAASVSFTGGVKGAWFAWQEGVEIDDGAGGAAGIDNFGLVMGSFGSIGATIDATATHSAPYSRAIPSTVLYAPGNLFGATQPPSVNCAMTTRFRTTSLDTRIRISRPQINQIELYEYGAMTYIGNDGIFGTNFQYRVTGTGVSGSNITAATVATLTMEPGAWAGGNEDWANAFTRVMKINGSTVSGAFSSGWTYNATGTLTAGQTVTFELTGTNGLGGETQTLTFTVI